MNLLRSEHRSIDILFKNTQLSESRKVSLISCITFFFMSTKSHHYTFSSLVKTVGFPDVFRCIGPSCFPNLDRMGFVLRKVLSWLVLYIWQHWHRNDVVSDVT